MDRSVVDVSCDFWYEQEASAGVTGKKDVKQPETRDVTSLEASLQQLLQEIAQGKEVLDSARQSRRRCVEHLHDLESKARAAGTTLSAAEKELSEKVEVRDQLKTRLQVAEEATEIFDRLTQDGKAGSSDSAGNKAKKAKEAAQAKAAKLKEGVE
eukprot:2707560-Pleurochrysis_carterae.AAC.1